MKKYLLYILTILTIFSACKEMDSTYKDFVVPNGLTYAQKADSLKSYAGFNKLRLQWLKPKSPSVKYAKVYWNNYTDSIKVDYDQNNDSMTIDIDGLSENSYTFFIINHDLNGNTSIPSEVTGTPYGANYLLSINDRTYTAALRDHNYTGSINWGPRTSDLMYTEVKYTDLNGNKKIVKVLPTENSISLPNTKPGEKFEYRSLFLPEKGIDTIAKEWRISDKPLNYKYLRDSWILSARGGNHDWGDGGGGQPSLLIDGLTNTGWHSRVGTTLPQVVVADMKNSLTIDHVILIPTAQANWRYMNNIDLYLTETPIIAEEPQASWGSPIASLTYTGGNDIKFNLSEPVEGRYLAVVFKNSTSNTYISFMELEVYGY